MCVLLYMEFPILKTASAEHKKCAAIATLTSKTVLNKDLDVSHINYEYIVSGKCQLVKHYFEKKSKKEINIFISCGRV